ncbi:BnaA10g08940D [Brassica napus]|uniref:BnaA10g08940D protein n=1 Tax=Brassica napus TaxID=3708 RepID=A0A078FQ28_BRANA|nr:BnaA10g08940D [Brassica napus]
MHGLMSYRRFGRARSLRSDRALDRYHVFGHCVAILLELLSDDSCFFRKAFRKEESISKKYLSKNFSSSGIWTLTSS